METKYKAMLEPYSYAIKMGRKQKHRCPNCGHNTFVRFIDEDGNYIGEDVGRCDREVKCGYFKKPSGELACKTVNTIIREKQTLFIDENLMRKSVAACRNNNLYKFMVNFFGNEKIVYDTFNLYNVGSNREGNVVFWQVDLNGRVRTGKIMKYGLDGKRVKGDPYAIRWVHGFLDYDRENVTFKQCYFGEHLVRSNYRTLYIVESEKSALFGYIAWQLMGEKDALFIATGGKNLLNTQKVAMLRDIIKEVYLMPDKDAFVDWFHQCLGRFKVLQWYGNKDYLPDDADIADWIILSKKRADEARK